MNHGRKCMNCYINLVHVLDIFVEKRWIISSFEGLLIGVPSTFGMKRRVYLVGNHEIFAFSPNLLKKNAVWIIKRHIALQWHLEDSRTALARIGGSGIRTHDDAIMRRTLSKHSYYRSVKYLCIFHSSE